MKVRYTRPALAVLEAILGYIAASSPQGARRVRSRIQALIGLLAIHPLIGTRTDDPSIRRLSTPPYPYLIFYETTKDEIILHAVRHRARDPSSMPGSTTP
ncbi:MAG: type II toxin-antitoxin system RelE/ParE family toxin [Beijerinckiaceae bacterium]|nr:type II toxin-antitoxin system RelE/ParE family toxin [Beijerinckiaceae bacterium]